MDAWKAPRPGPLPACGERESGSGTRKILRRRGDVFDAELLERGRDRLQRARELGLEHVLDTDQQLAAFERIAAMTKPR